ARICALSLERNLVVVRLRRATLGRRCTARTGAARSRTAARKLFPAAFVATTATARTSPQHLHHFADDLELAAFLARLLVVPGIQLKRAFDKNRPAFLEVFAGYFRRATPERDVNESDFFTFLSG